MEVVRGTARHLPQSVEKRCIVERHGDIRQDVQVDRFGQMSDAQSRRGVGCRRNGLRQVVQDRDDDGGRDLRPINLKSAETVGSSDGGSQIGAVPVGKDRPESPSLEDQLEFGDRGVFIRADAPPAKAGVVAPFDRAANAGWFTQIAKVPRCRDRRFRRFRRVRDGWIFCVRRWRHEHVR
ncbi:hypothetical protein [Prosthecodimorpha staleyi]|uniref:Uncharacterized protein n=1 Tax=Prosthecodimorpha staleyi TaxID=2840188 RepID=A0A947D9Y0_9HYPH|nr:hypothetical protein [Prosthecodimorpha staleyi]MBT9292496.1 hypothetical protein [Prosthecodimorpha staleyi]